MEGNGLGLALVRRILEPTEASIHVESILGKGSGIHGIHSGHSGE